MGGLIFSFMDKNREFTIHCLAFFSRIFITFYGVFRAGFCQGSIWLRGSWRKDCLAAFEVERKKENKETQPLIFLPLELMLTQLGCV